MNVVFLMRTVPGYFSFCIESLAALAGIDALLICEHPSGDAPYDRAQVQPSGVEVLSYPVLPGGEEVLDAVMSFKPDVVVVTGWQIPAYRHVLKHLPKGILRVLLMDNQWLGTLKQRLGIAIAPWYLHPLYDVAFLPGRNQEVFATKLGFRNDQIWRGAYCCHHDRFAAAAQSPGERETSFLFVGRLVEEKGIDTLLKAYEQYRDSCEAPWRLVVYGTGPLGKKLQGVAGVELRGFAQPNDIPAVYRESGCFVLPSNFEPWGTVVHEAAATGLPIICSTACGSAPHLIEDGVNGYLVEPGNPRQLAGLMLRYSSLSPKRRADMGAMSSVLASRYTPERWAELFRERAQLALGTQKGSNH